jgi:hypothetical protein
LRSSLLMPRTTALTLLTHGEHVGWTGDALGPGKLGDVDEAFDTFFDFAERTVSDELRDLATDVLAHGVTAFDVFPRVVLKLLEAEGDAFFLAVHFEDLHFETLTDADQFGRMVEAAPRHVGDVEETVHAVEVHEHTEVGDVLDHADDLVAEG